MLKEICLKVCNDKNETRRIYFRAEKYNDKKKNILAIKIISF